MQSQPNEPNEPRDDRRLEKTRDAGIFKRGNRYVIRFRAHGRERKRFARTLAEARSIKASAKADLDRGEYRETSKVTFADYAARWLDGYSGRTSRGIRQTTLDEYRRVVEDGERGPLVHFGARRIEDEDGNVSFVGGRKLSEITPPDLKSYVRSLVEAGLATSTVRNFLTPLRAMLADAFEDGLIRVNPAAGIRVPAPDRLDEDGDAEERVRALDEKQLAALIAATAPEYRLLVRFLAGTGLRIGEAVALRWSDLTWGARPLVKVRRRYYKGTFEPPKSRYGRRDVPLAPGLARDLWNLRKTADGDGALVFPGRDGAPLAQSSAYRAIRAAGKTAGVPWAGNHTLRHTCATMLFRAGLNAKQVQVWLGHHSPAFTLSTYVHLLPGDLPDPAFMDELVASVDENVIEAAERAAESVG